MSTDQVWVSGVKRSLLQLELEKFLIIFCEVSKASDQSRNESLNSRNSNLGQTNSERKEFPIHLLLINQ